MSLIRTSLIALLAAAATRAQLNDADFTDNNGITAAQAASPLWYLPTGSCLPSAAEDGQGHQTNGVDVPVVLCGVNQNQAGGCPTAPAWTGPNTPYNGDGTFEYAPTYYKTGYCPHDQSWRVMYAIYFKHDASHKSDWEWEVTSWKKSDDGKWYRYGLLMETDGDYGVGYWRDIPNTFNDLGDLFEDGNKGRDHPKLFIGKRHHSVHYDPESRNKNTCVEPDFRANDYQFWSSYNLRRSEDVISKDWDYGKATNPTGFYICDDRNHVVSMTAIERAVPSSNDLSKLTLEQIKARLDEVLRSVALRIESQTLNEHIVDCFGIVIKQFSLGQTAENGNWDIAQGWWSETTMTRNKWTANYLRTFKIPESQSTQPDIGPKIWNDTLKFTSLMDPHDYCGIGNHAFYQAALRFKGKTWENIGKIWYDALTDQAFKDPGNQTYKGWKNLTIRHARSLFGEDGLPPWVLTLCGLQVLTAALPIIAWLRIFIWPDLYHGPWADVSIALFFPFLFLGPSILIILTVISCLRPSFALELCKTILATFVFGFIAANGDNANFWPWAWMCLVGLGLCYYPVLYYIATDYRAACEQTACERESDTESQLREGGNGQSLAAVEREEEGATRQAEQRDESPDVEVATESTALLVSQDR
ncbi:thermolysin metallopeptidase [Lophiotrema nucula]|uniref:Thermolysin metallopeptidase n=1 Tax=Lophiotrema nucula TaxID=690887 RepID=A0A6A5YNV1_9PLEO|nr:thermolysin metallopeptidase [Lophiotrema nucula]